MAWKTRFASVGIPLGRSSFFAVGFAGLHGLVQLTIIHSFFQVNWPLSDICAFTDHCAAVVAVCGCDGALDMIVPPRRTKLSCC